MISKLLMFYGKKIFFGNSGVRMLVHGTVYLQVFHYLTFILGEEEREGQEPEEEQEGEL